MALQPRGLRGQAIMSQLCNTSEMTSVHHLIGGGFVRRFVLPSAHFEALSRRIQVTKCPMFAGAASISNEPANVWGSKSVT
jgi:hypothetical protein